MTKKNGGGAAFPRKAHKDKDLCEECKQNPVESLHGCPYQEEVNNSTDTKYCNCCDDCMQECAMDV